MRATTAAIFSLVAISTTPALGQNQSSPYELVDQFARVLNRIEQEYVEPTSREKLVQGAIEGMVSGLDPHSAYMPPDEYEDFKADTTGQFAGIGVEVDLRNGQVVVIAPIAGSPAEKAGIRGGDRIVSVNGILPDTLPLTEIVHRMRGPKGSSVHLIVRRPRQSSTLQFDVVRDDVQLPSVYVRRLDHDIAYVRIVAFQEGTHTELLGKLGPMLTERGIHGLLLDLRQNPGGLVSESVAVADEFLGSGLLFFTRQRTQVTERVETTSHGHFEDVPMVTLVDEGSASAAEILAGALKDRKRSRLVGTRTFGKGTVQTIVDLPDGAGLRLTTMRYYTPSGVGIQASGVQPDEVIEAPDSARTEPLREFDLPNHLPSETSPRTPRAAPDDSGTEPLENQCERPKPSRSVAERIAQIPSSPDASDDTVLSRGYKLLLSLLNIHAR